MPLHPDRAARLTYIAQVAVVVGASVAVLIHLKPLPEVSADLPTVELPAPTTPGGGGEGRAPEDWTSAVSLLRQIHDVEPPAAQEPDTSTAAVPTPTTPQEDPALAGASDVGTEVVGVPGWRYVGVVHSRGRITALVSINNRQQWVRVGDIVSDSEVLEVTPDYLTVQMGPARRRLDLTTRPPMAAGDFAADPSTADFDRLRESMRSGGDARQRAIEEARRRAGAREPYNPADDGEELPEGEPPR